MKKIFIPVLLICAGILLTACQNSSAKSQSQVTPRTSQQPVATVTHLKYVTFQDNQSNISFQHPQDYKVSQGSPSGDLIVSANIKTTNTNIKETFKVDLRKNQPTKTQIEDIDSDNYNGRDRTVNGIKYTCYERMNAYIKDTYKQKGQAYAGSAGDTGYRVDCFGRRKDGNYIHIFYQNDTNDRHLLRNIQQVITKIMETAE